MPFLPKTLTGRPETPRRPPPAVPEGMTVYAIGDIHGRADLLGILHGLIAADAAARPGEKIAVYLGDYVDRGPRSREAVDMALAGPGDGLRCRRLKGNHEAAMLRFLEAPATGRAWLSFGGRETLRSYGIEPPDPDDPEALMLASDALLDRLPLAHLEFLEGLEPYAVYGDYLFVHAGIRPGVPLGRQIEEDLLWIRSSFLSSRLDHGKVVVHGHSADHRPVVRPNRIGIDTRAYETDRLTCLVLSGGDRAFLST